MRTTWAAVIAVTWAGVARAEVWDLDFPKAPVKAEAAAGDPAAGSPAPAPVGIPWGFYQDDQGRVMQVSFDLTRRAYLGTAYAPRRLPGGAVEVGPAAFDFGAQYELLSADGLTRYRWHLLEGEAVVHSFGLDVTAVRFDLSHRYTAPLVRITTFFGTPARHDFWLNVGVFSEAGHLERAPRGIDGEEVLTLGTVQATLDLWQSADLRSYLRLRAGPGAEMRFGPWGREARYVGYVPRAAVEGDFFLDRRAFHKLSFCLRGDLLRSVSLDSRPLPGGSWLADGEAAYEWILVALNDQPVTLRLAGAARVRDGAAPGAPPADATSPGWEWRGTAGFRVSFFSPPLPPHSSARAVTR
jgi:hypothetical protein